MRQRKDQERKKLNKTEEVRKHLVKHGSITQRLAWNKSIGNRQLEASRLSGIIYNLRYRENWGIDTVYKRTKDGISYAEYILENCGDYKERVKNGR